MLQLLGAPAVQQLTGKLGFSESAASNSKFSQIESREHRLKQLSHWAALIQRIVQT